MPATRGLGATSYPRRRIAASRRDSAARRRAGNAARRRCRSASGNQARQVRPEADWSIGIEKPIGTVKLASLGPSTRATVTMRPPLGTLTWQDWSIATASWRICG